jgi:hypothetical protein
VNGSDLREKDDAPVRGGRDRGVRGGPPAPGSLGARRSSLVARRSSLVAVRRSLASALLLAACTTTTTVTYVPSPEQPRLDLRQGQATLQRFVGLECERLRGAGHAAGETQVSVTLDDAGLATEAGLAASTGDTRIDGIIGAVAAQLTLAHQLPRVRATTLHATYQCAEDGSVTATLAPLLST